MDILEFERTLNEWGRQSVPFLFMVDFEMEKPEAFRLAEIDSNEIMYDINGITNVAGIVSTQENVRIDKHPIPFAAYKTKFDTVYNHLHYGDSYLTNLTIKTEVSLNVSLKDVFYSSHARYKLLYKDHFLVFSPEIFVLMKNSKIFTYPMKGTIDATLPNAASQILEDKKELAEHITIVDLLRNDLSQVADNVTVSKFRYIEEINTSEKDLLQVSSEIVGNLPEDYRSQLGTLLLKLLPAGSVTRAPKNKTVTIIGEAEKEHRGYYTGIVGIFDGQTFDSGVMIRFIERSADKYFYRSGGGITTQSKGETEYQEAIDKIYVPIA